MEGRHARSENTLSFSELLFSIDDLHLESNVSSLDENQNPNSSLDGDDFLGFFIDENKSRNAPAEGVVFCGKFIDTNSRNTQKPDHKNKIDSNKNKNNTVLARRNSDSLCKYSNAHSNSLRSTRSKSVPVLAGKKEGSNYKNERTSKLACSSKSRWEGFMFGSGRYPTKMELSDLRSRQLRFKNGGEEEKSSAGKRMPVLIRVLGCVGGFDGDSDTMIKSSTGTYVSSY